MWPWCLRTRLVWANSMPTLTVLRQTTTAALARETAALESLRGHLRALSPLATLERGYAVLRTPSGAVVSDAGEVSVGDELEARVARGRVSLNVTATEGDEGS